MAERWKFVLKSGAAVELEGPTSNSHSGAIINGADGKSCVVAKEVAAQIFLGEKPEVVGDPAYVKDRSGDMWMQREDGSYVWIRYSDGTPLVPGERLELYSYAALEEQYGPLTPCDESGNPLP